MTTNYTTVASKQVLIDGADNGYRTTFPLESALAAFGLVNDSTSPDATIGTATMAAGTVIVNTTRVTATSVIMLTVQSLGTVSTPKSVSVVGRVVGSYFTIASEDVTDTSVVGWWIIEPK
jgi:hypothetical protein